jgi:hypothetical protein
VLHRALFTLPFAIRTLQMLCQSVAQYGVCVVAGESSQRRAALLRFTSELIKFRRSCPQLQRDHFPG